MNDRQWVRSAAASLAALLIGFPQDVAAQGSPFELGPELDLPPPPSDWGQTRPTIAWTGSAFLVEWMEFTYPHGERTRVASLRDDGTFGEDLSESVLPGCRLPRLACDGHERCLLACVSCEEGGCATLLTLFETDQPVWEDHPRFGVGDLVWQSNRFVLLAIDDARELLSLVSLDPSARVLDAGTQLLALPPDSMRCDLHPNDGGFFVVCQGGGSTAVLPVASDGATAEWQDLPVDALAMREVDGRQVVAWVRSEDDGQWVHFGTLCDLQLCEGSVPALGPVGFAEPVLVASGEGAALVLSSQAIDPPVNRTALVTALAGLAPTQPMLVGEGLPGIGVSYPEYGVSAASSGGVIAIGYQGRGRVRLVYGSLADQGMACAAPTDCASGWCVDGVCCDRSCASACEACNLGGSEGRCSDEGELCRDVIRGGGCDIGGSGFGGGPTLLVAAPILAEASRRRRRRDSSRVVTITG